MAKIVRDKISRKTKGYGFVSLLDPGDAAKAIREMNGACLRCAVVLLTWLCWCAHVDADVCPLASVIRYRRQVRRQPTHQSSKEQVGRARVA